MIDPQEGDRRHLTGDEIASLIAIVGERNLALEREDLEAYSRDGTQGLSGWPAALARAGSTAEVASLLAFCNSRRIPVTPQGGRTSLSGGAIPVMGGVALSLERLNRILEIDEENGVAVVEAGVITQTLQEAVEALGLYYPPDPGSRGSCTIGGNVAENAGGPHSAKYGVTGHWVLGLEAVFA
ncbi:MAG TPA: FAD-binding oxidoreductase, partial [Thermoanaerobaculia bacterium]